MGARNFDEVMCVAAESGHTEMIKLCREWGANDFNEAMRSALKAGTLRL